MRDGLNRKAPRLPKLREGRGERGIALILALIALLIIAALAATMIYMATSETSLVTSQKAAARSFYSAMGGLEEARYRLIPGLTAQQGGLNNFDALAPAGNTEPFARIPAIPGPGVPPSEILYVINVPNGAVPANLDAAGSVPTAAEDQFRAAEVPAAAVLRGVASNQLNAGTLNALDWQWVRINLKTELSSQQDLNLDGVRDQDPIFLYQGRQYRGTDLLLYDPDGAGISPPGGALPPPWGPDPLLGWLPGTAPITDRPCVAPICATPVYLLTARGNVAVGGAAASRLVRVEVGIPAAFSLDGGIFSQPAIDLQGNMQASGRDICDPDCSTMLDDPLTGANENGFTNIFPPDLPAIGWGTNFDSWSQASVPANCRSVIPAQSEAPPAAQQPLLSTSGRTDPHCDPALNPNCVCDPPVCGHAGCQYSTCVMANSPPLFDLDSLFSALIPLARTMQPPVNNYYAQPSGSGLACDATGCQGNNLEMGGFPFADPVNQTGADFINGLNADPIITYVPGDLKCTNTCTGAGILLVDGDLELNSSMAFYGIVLVRGNVSILGGGNPPTPCNIYGSLITRGGVDTNLGGSICFQYNSCAQRSAAYYSPLTGLAFRELPQ